MEMNLEQQKALAAMQMSRARAEAPPDDATLHGVATQLKDRFMEGPAKAGPGFAEGVLEVGHSIQNAGAAADKLFGIERSPSDVADSEWAQQHIDDYHKKYGDSAWAEGGRIGGNLAASAPVMLAGGEALAPVTAAIKTAAPVVAPVVDFLAGTGGTGYKTGLLSRSVNAAEQGAGYAGLTSSGNDAPLLEQLETGAAVASVIPGAGDALVHGGRKLAQLAGHLMEPFLKSGQETITGRILNEYAEGGSTKIVPPPLPNMDLNTAQQTGNRGLIQLQRILEQRSGNGMDTAADAARTTNDQAIKTAMSKVGDLDADAGKAIDEQLTAAEKAIKAKTRLAWKSAGVDEATNIPTEMLNSTVQGYVGGLKIIEKDTLENTGLLGALEKVVTSGEQTNLGEVQAWRSRLITQTRMMWRAGDADTARVLGGLADKVAEFLEDIPALSAMGGGGPSKAQIAAYNAARAATKSQKNLLTVPKSMRAALGVDSYGADKVPVSKLADNFLNGKPEDLMAYLAATKDVPGANKALRDAFAQKFLAATTRSVEGEPVSAAKITVFLNKFDHVVNSDIFSTAQRDMIGRIKDAANMAARVERGAPPGGADSAKKLLGNDYLDVLIGRWTGKAVSGMGALAGGALGSYLGPTGATVGALLGGSMAKVGERSLVESLYSAPRERVIKLLVEAMSDPAMAQALMTKAGTSLATIPVAVRSRLIAALSVPVVSETVRRGTVDNLSPAQP